MLKKIPIISLICAVIYVAAIKIITVTGLTMLQIPMLAPFVSVSIIAIPLYFGMLHIRKVHYDNSINFSQTFYSGVIISVFTAIFVYVIFYLLEMSNILIPDLILDNQLTAEAYIKAYKPSETEIAEIHQNTKNSMAPFVFAQVHFIMVLLISAFSATILSLFIRNKDTFTEIKK
ncbi:DUF4199 domain-containing protein [uncultured Cytophaga sp.]|uniref:DUF4199 domain-containing protein n=1 Tax=uncultured Cytophaga sp. TaxID=160238 RepID=UPI00261D7E44|nr:DUF4199 domain-containing protein [uncultured Cytophaga sp.]